MASTKLMETKEGKRFYQICVSRGHGKSSYKMRWYCPDGWSKRSVERELRKVVSEFERACSAGEVLNREQRKSKEAEAAAEAGKLKTVRQYANEVFMAAKELTISENARTNYQSVLDKHVFPVLGNMLLQDVTPAMINKLLLDFQKRGYAHETTIRLYNVLSGVFSDQ